VLANREIRQICEKKERQSDFEHEGRAFLHISFLSRLFIFITLRFAVTNDSFPFDFWVVAEVDE